MNAAKQQAADTRWAADRGETLTVPQKVLRAAVKLPEPFHESTLILAAWREDQKSFGLRGHETEAPDANRIRCVVQGQKGLVARGWLAKHGDYRYGLTVPGRQEGERLANGATADDRRDLPADWIPPDIEEEVCRLYDSEAYRRFVCGKEVRPGDALDWWGCDDTDGDSTVRYGADLIGTYLADAEGYVGVLLKIGTRLDEPVLERMSRLQSALVGRFGRRFKLGA